MRFSRVAPAAYGYAAPHPHPHYAGLGDAEAYGYPRAPGLGDPAAYGAYAACPPPSTAHGAYPAAHYGGPPYAPVPAGYAAAPYAPPGAAPGVAYAGYCEAPGAYPVGYSDYPPAYAEYSPGYAEPTQGYADYPPAYAEYAGYADYPGGYANDPAFAEPMPVAPPSAMADAPSHEYGAVAFANPTDPSLEGYVHDGASPYNPNCLVMTNVHGYEGEAQGLEGYVHPTSVNAQCHDFTPNPGTTPVPEGFRPLF